MNEHDAPVVAASGTVTFDGGGSPVTADAGLTVTDVSSTTLASAAVVIGGFITGDTLTVGTAGGLTTGFSSGTLTLSGSASLATYPGRVEIGQSGFTSNGEPTPAAAATPPARSPGPLTTAPWSSNTGTSTVDTVHVAPTVVAGGTVTFDGGGAAVALDPGLTATDVDSDSGMSSATVTVAGAIAGDTLISPIRIPRPRAISGSPATAVACSC